MIRSKFGLFLIIAVSVFLFFIMALGVMFFYPATDNPVSVALFKFTYRVTPVKKAFLEAYSPRKRDVSGGYIPPQVDEFLCQRIETTNDTGETAAIVNFYAIQAGGREGSCIFKVSETAREKIAAEIIKQMDDNPNLWGQIILLEQVRQGKSLGKASISGKQRLNLSTKEDWEKWKAEYLPGGREKFREWWNSNLSWKEKQKIDPLKDAEISVNACC